jgi:DNA-binding CsgD family transcriptional regulator
MERERLRRARDEVRHLVGRGLDWVGLSATVSEVIARLVPFERSCWHTVDPGTVLFTGNVNRNIACSGSWLAEYEYVVEDVNKWWFLARSGRRAGAMSLATHGDLSRSARHRSQDAYGIGDELRVSFVADGTYWGAAGFLRDSDRPWFTEDDVAVVAALSDAIADALRRALVATAVVDVVAADHGPGVVVFDEHGVAESVSPAAERWIAELVEIPAPVVPSESKVVQAVAAQARILTHPGAPPLAARARVRTRSGSWLVVHGTPLSSSSLSSSPSSSAPSSPSGAGRTAVIIQPAGPYDVAPLIALSHGLTEREAQITRLCVEGRPTKAIAAELHVSPYTVQDHLKSIFDKTGVRSRNELVGQIFLQHYATRWENVPDAPSGWMASALPGWADGHPGTS